MNDFRIPAEITSLVPSENVRDTLNVLEQSWEQYVTSGTENKIIRNEILRSWLRCRDNYVDPHTGYNSKIMPCDHLRERYNDAIELINVSIPLMRALYNSVKGSGYIVMLLDQDGIILELFGDTGMQRQAESVNAVPGSSCDESFIGTTAPGICLKEKIPVRVFYKEHFCMHIHYWACSAAPIFDPAGRLIGSLDISSLYENYHPYTLGMVIATAKAIERELCYRAVNKELKKSYHYIDTIINSMSEGMILFNEKGEINYINTACAKLLGVSADECHGTLIKKIIKNAEAVTGIIARDQNTYDKKLSLFTEKGVKEVSANFKVVKDKDESFSTYMVTINEMDKMQKVASKNAGLTAYYSFDDIIFVSKKMQEIITYAQKIGMNDATVMIEGESGTGKELLAQAIHNYSNRNKNPFMVVNCAALPKELIHSELFGYDEGAFTGARKGGRAGKFELANGGTIFLDEIGDMPLEVQANMLRVLQEKQFMRIGGNQRIALDIRIIAATNKQLTAEVEQGNFRLDLYYRLNTVPVKIPALRERPEDIAPLAHFFIKRQCLSMGRSQVFLSAEAEKIFLAYHWPGNIRELENIIVRIVNVLEGEIIKTDHLPHELLRFEPKTGLVIPLEDMEKKAIVDALCHYDKNISRTAQGLGITRATLYKKIKKFNIN